ncbi:CIR protein PIR protein [Plasmodium vinckei brucechwatti]|uniref:CIR protein PIR protein n=1 Tax=Plasmodium vinckei brucechwatti TaxID=119398 RepID=A0A6V7RZC2_PLAVN|nr:CIR protein PIR protein [Plasmodium vinckei brucechwatti]
MAESCYNFKDVSIVFNDIDSYAGVQKQGNGLVEFIKNPISDYCRFANMRGSGPCFDYFQHVNSGVIYFLKTLENKFNSKYDKLAEYAILLLCYKLNQHTEHKYKFANLNTFYTNHIEKKKYYNNKIKDNGPTYKEIIDKKKNLMNMSIKEILKFYEALKTLCSIYNECNESELDCNKCSEDANKFAVQFKELNKDSKNIDNISYSQMLSTLSNDYDNLKYIYDNKCTNSPPLPMIKTSPSKLIPALSTFSVIPVFLGIAYKYSLFGVDKLFQRQYIRKKLKKVKKKLKLNI